MPTSGQEKPPLIRAFLPDAFFAIKVNVKPLADNDLLSSIFSFIIFCAFATFGVLFFFFYIQDQQSETVITKERLDGFTCESISALPPRPLQATCRNLTSGNRQRCVTATDGFGGYFISGSTLSQQNYLSIDFMEPVFEPSYESCIESFFDEHCGEVPFRGFAASSPGIWAYTTGDRIQSSPVIGSDGTIFVGSTDHKLHAIDPSHGTAKWTYTTDGPVAASPVIGSDGIVYIGSTDHKLHAIDPSDGTAKWTYTTGDRILASPVIGSDGTIFVGSNGQLHAIDPSDGIAKWTYTTGGYIESSPVIGSDGTIYVGSNGELHAVDPSDGRAKWTYTTGAGTSWSPVIGSDGTIFVGSTDHKLHAIDISDGTAKWTYTTGDFIVSSPVIGSDGTIFVVSYDDHKLHAIDPSNGIAKWTYTTGGSITSSPAIGSDGTIYVGSHDSKLYLISPITPLDENHCVITSLSPPATFSQAIYLPTKYENGPSRTQCNTEFHSIYCNASSPQAQDFRLQFCAAFQDHPPFSCTREVSRNIIEAMSLSFSFAELAYTALLFFAVQYLWRKFKRTLSLSAPAPALPLNVPKGYHNNIKSTLSVKDSLSDEPEFIQLG